MEMINGDKSHLSLSFSHSFIFGELGEERRREELRGEDSFEKKGLRRAWRSEGGGARSSEGGEAWRSKEGLPLQELKS